MSGEIWGFTPGGGGEYASVIQFGRSQGYCEKSCNAQDSPQQSVTQWKMSVVPRQRNPKLDNLHFWFWYLHFINETNTCFREVLLS